MTEQVRLSTVWNGIEESYENVIGRIIIGTLFDYLLKTRNSMKTLERITFSLVFVTVIVIFVGLLSCHDNSDSSSDFIVKVDSFKVPAAVTSATPFDVVFYGTVGRNGCYSFKTFNKAVKGNDISIEVWGTFDYKTGSCPEELVLLDGIKLNLTIPFPGTYRIVIKEPADYTLVRQITVN